MQRRSPRQRQTRRKKDEAERALKEIDFDDNEIEAYFGLMESENRVMILEGTVHIHSLD